MMYMKKVETRSKTQLGGGKKKNLMARKATSQMAGEREVSPIMNKCDCICVFYDKIELSMFIN